MTVGVNGSLNLGASGLLNKAQKSDANKQALIQKPSDERAQRLEEIKKQVENNTTK